MIHTY